MTVEAEGVRATADLRDAALIERAQVGDRDAFAQLIEPRAQRLLRTARAILGNEADAYESAQEALIAAWINLPGLRRADRFDVWLNRTLANKCRDTLRRRRRRSREIELSGVDVEIADPAHASVSHVWVLAAFDQLSIDDRQILVLHHLHDLPLAQVAGQLGIPIGTAKSRLWSARRALERALEVEP
jgi:RNA polymerase sigma-70 factor (ECF subfamily)